MKPVKEAAEQIALVARCRKEGILIISTENSLNFPVASILHFVAPEKQKRFIAFIRQLLSKLTQKRISLGMEVGYPDLFVPEYKLFIEMKRRNGGILSKEQKIMHEKLINLGYAVKICHGAEQAWNEIKENKK